MSAKSERPNILLIMTDQQTWRALGAVGNPHVKTPNMDRLAREGTLFTQAYCASPVCGPSRMSIATGMPPHEHGYTTHQPGPEWNWTERGLESFGHQLRKAGYSTSWIGKWHATDFVPKTADGTPGFTYLRVNPEPATSREHLGWDIDSQWADRAVEFLGTPQPIPYFLGLSIHNPHDICYWIMNLDADEIKQAIGAEGVDLPPLPDNFEIGPHEMELMRYRREVKKYGPELQWTHNWTGEDWRKYLYVYYRLVEKADHEIGRVLDALDASGQAGNTLVVFTSDHGEGCASHRLVVKLTPYEEALRVPLIFRQPGHVPAGNVVKTQITSGLDLAPTILDYAGAPSLARARGISLRDVISGDKTQLRDHVVSELYPDNLNPEIAARILRTEGHKYIFAVVNEVAEQALYDLRQDPGEMHNLAALPDSLNVLSEMHGRLSRWMHQTSDPLMASFESFIKAG